MSDDAGAGGLSWSSIPTHLLLAELARRDDAPDAAQPPAQPQCGSMKRGSYDTALHVFALFLILTLSTLSCGFPLLSRRNTAGKRQKTIIFLCQHLGTGVLMATAFVHLLPTAFNSLTDPCLPYAFSKGYKPLAGLIAMVSAMVVVVVESILTVRGAGHSHSHHLWDDEEDDQDSEGVDRAGDKIHQHEDTFSARRAHRPRDIALDDLQDTDGLMAGVSPLPEASPAIRATRANNADDRLSKSFADDDRESLDLDLELDELQTDMNGGSHSGFRAVPQREGAKQMSLEPAGPHIPSPEEQKRLLLQCLLLEAGILFHSIFIGMALSVATGPTFAVFLIAIAFHQSFEGLALGSRIAAIHFPRSSPRPWLMVLAYGATTPIGQAIGLFVHNLYDPMSQTGLLMVGFMNAISSGLLLFAGLVQLLAEDFLTEKSYKSLRGRKRTHAFLAVFAGAGLMAGVGAFA